MRLLNFTLALLAAVLLLGVALGYGGRLWYELDLLAHFRLHLLGLSVIIGLTSLVARAPAAFWNALAAAALAAAGLAPLWQEPGPAGEGVPLTVMAANLHTPNPEAAAMRRALLAADADVLVTVESDRELVEAADGLSAHYPYRMIPETTRTQLGTVIWSKFPIVNGSRLHPFVVGATIRVGPGIELSVIGVHLPHVLFRRQEEWVEALGGFSADLPRPLVVLGDFNATPWSWAMRLSEQLTGTRRVGGVLRTWDGSYPTPLVRVPEPFGIPIDHVLVSEGVGVESIGTLEIPGSDHDAVRAVLRIPGARGASETARAPVSSGQ